MTFLLGSRSSLPKLSRILSKEFDVSIASSLFIQKRQRGQVPVPRKRNPIWFVRKNRTIHDDLITTENQNFIKEVVTDRFGPPSLIKGVQSFEKSVSVLPDLSTLNADEWTPRIRRSGAIARKIGSVPMWTRSGQKIFTTMLQIVDNHVVKYYPPDEYQPAQKPKIANIKKFGCLMVGAESMDPSLLTKEYCGLFKDTGVMPKKILARFIVSPQSALPPGTPINATHFRVDDYVDVRGQTIYHGFQGVMKRHGFHGMPATHGVTKTHRRPGNIGAGGEKARVWPGTKLPGHMGRRYRVSRGLKIWRINTKYNVIWVRGTSVPGEVNNMVYIFDTFLPLRRCKMAPPFPTSNYESDESLPEDIWSVDAHPYDEPTIFYKQE